MNTENLKGLIASELIIVAREEKDKRPTELNFEELIDVTDSIVKKLSIPDVVEQSEQLCDKCEREKQLQILSKQAQDLNMGYD